MTSLLMSIPWRLTQSQIPNYILFPFFFIHRVDWDAVGGLDGHIRSLKEMVVLPLLYPELFSRFRWLQLCIVVVIMRVHTVLLLLAECCSLGLLVSWFCTALEIRILLVLLGTGKTLVARALANTCSQQGKKVTGCIPYRFWNSKFNQVSFFMRKGADCLSKWVGEAERQLRLLFEQVCVLISRCFS